MSSSVLSSDPAPAVNAEFGQKVTNAVMPKAGVYDLVIQPGQTAPRQTFANEFLASLKMAVAPPAIIGWLASAGYGVGTDSSPNYTGSTGSKFGQSLGAAAARASSETIFGNGVLAPVLHLDPRYYRMGKGNNFFKRTGYAITRPVITRTNGGHHMLNLWDLGGDFAGAALTPVYYPPLNTSTQEILKTWGGSVGGDALAFFVSEYLPDVLHALHLRAAN